MKRFIYILAAFALMGAVSCQPDEEVAVHASFTTDKEFYDVGDPVVLTNTSTAENALIAICKWELGKGVVSYETTPENISYDQAGEYVIKLTVTSEQPLGKELRIRIPGWCKSYTLSVNGNKVDSTTDKGYTVIKEWKTGDLIVLNMDMPVEKVSADPRVRQNTGKRALQRGPLVYCLEETDNARKTLPTSH